MIPLALTVLVIVLVILVAFGPRDPKDRHGPDFDNWTA